MDLGSVSSWIAAAISLASAGGAVIWSWWNRPKVDWIWDGEVLTPRPDTLQSEIKGRVGNFGDGNAHRVGVWIRLSDRVEPQRITTCALLRPGESVEFEAKMHIAGLDLARVFVTWTPAPIRRRSERTSASVSPRSAFALTQQTAEVDRTYRSSQD